MDDVDNQIMNDFDDGGKVPPHNPTAEKALIGSVLLDPQKVTELSIDGADFHLAACASIFTVTHEMVISGLNVDSVTVAEKLESKGWLEQIGGVLVLHEMMETVPHAGHIDSHAQIVKDYSTRREVIRLAREAEAKAFDVTFPVENLQSLVTLNERTSIITPQSITELAAEHPKLADPVIEGLLRVAEVMNVIASTKVGKSWLVYGLLLSIATSRRWLDTFDCHAGNVLLVDNELHPATVGKRLPDVAEAMNILPEEYRDKIDVVSLRGRLVDLYGLRKLVDSWGKKYSVIVLDAWYRMIPPGVSENDNAAMAQAYNTIDQYAAQTNAAWILVHHSSKGSQSEKRVTDVGSGAGAQSRAADSHLVIREHEDDNLYVLDAAVRSFPPVVPIALRWNFPLWHRDDMADPRLLKGRKTAGEERQQENDREGMDVVEGILAEWNSEIDREATPNRITEKSPYGQDKTRNLLAKLLHADRVTREPITIKNNQTFRYLVGVSDTEDTGE